MPFHHQLAIFATLLLPLVLLGPSHVHADEEAEALLGKAAAALEAGEYQAALDAIEEGLDPLWREHFEELNGEIADAVSDLQDDAPESEEACAALIRELLAPSRAVGIELARHELVRARAHCALGDLEASVASLGLALSKDLDLWSEVKRDRDLAEARKTTAFDLLALRIEKGMSDVHTDRALATLFFEEASKARLAFTQPTGKLLGRSPFLIDLYRFVNFHAKRGKEKDEPFGRKMYERHVVAGLLLRSQMSGWPYRMGGVHGGPQAAALARVTRARFEEARDEPVGPFRAFVAFFPAYYQEQTEFTAELLDYLEERSIVYYAWAVSGVIWSLKSMEEMAAELGRPEMADGVAELKAEWTAREAKVRTENAAIWAFRGEAWECVELARAYLRGEGVDKDYELARQWFEVAFEGGRLWAGVDVADMYARGQGVEADGERAIDYYIQAARRGLPAGYRYAAYIYRDGGAGVEVDGDEAYRLFEKAAKAGDVTSRVMVAACLQEGIGVEPDAEAANAILLQLVSEGVGLAAHRLAFSYQYGHGNAVDLDKAYEWFEKGVELGDVVCIDCMGLMYHRGVGRPIDEAKARAWYERARDAGYTSATRRLACLAFDLREGKAGLREAYALAKEGLEIRPVDRIALSYAWAAAQHIGKSSEARELAATYLEKNSPSAIERPLVEAMAARKFSLPKVLEALAEHGIEPGAELTESQGLALGAAYFAAAHVALAKRKKSDARELFQQVLDLDIQTDSIRFSAERELARLKD